MARRKSFLLRNVVLFIEPMILRLIIRWFWSRLAPKFLMRSTQFQVVHFNMQRKWNLIVAKWSVWTLPVSGSIFSCVSAKIVSFAAAFLALRTTKSFADRKTLRLQVEGHLQALSAAFHLSFHCFQSMMPTPLQCSRGTPFVSLNRIKNCASRLSDQTLGLWVSRSDLR